MLLALASVALACDSPTAAPSSFAYDPTGLTNGQLYRWDNGRRLDVYVVPVSGQGPPPALNLSQSVNAALGRWNSVPRGERFTLVATGSAADAHIVVYDRLSPMPVLTPDDCPYASTSATGYTYFCPVNGRALRLPLPDGRGRATVLVRIDLARITTAAQLDAVVMHELGHAVGIGGHSTDSLDVMFVSPRVSSPSGRDTQTLRYLLAQAADILL